MSHKSIEGSKSRCNGETAGVHGELGKPEPYWLPPGNLPHSLPVVERASFPTHYSRVILSNTAEKGKEPQAVSDQPPLPYQPHKRERFLPDPHNRGKC